MYLSACPLVAVVTPVFNGEEYLAAAMESVQALDYPNLVHVVLDNASNDATPEIIDRYRYQRVPVLSRRRPETVPMAANWNLAVAMIPSEARYFRILCADDTLLADAITAAVAVAERDPEVGLVGNMWRAAGLVGEELPADREVFVGRDVIRGYLRREHSALSGMHVLVRRAQLDAGRPFYDETIPSFDSDANLRICMNAKYGFVRRELGLWRIHVNSTTARVAEKMLAHEICWLTLLDRYGPQALGFREYIECRTAYRRHLLRRLLKARLRAGGARTFANGLAQLRLADDPVRASDFAGALAEWARLALMLQRDRVGKPREARGLRHAACGAVRAPEF